jgi:hypothetical protein
MDTETVDPHLAAKIVRSYVQHHKVEAGRLSDLITTVHRALGELGQLYRPEEVRTPALPLCPCDVPYTRTMWSAWIAATGGQRYAGILAYDTA